jgi:radical SAM protein with 4Fe4S-binding SPASM domain
MLYRLCKDTFVRSIGVYGYIYSQLTKHDRTYSESGGVFLKALSRKPQSMDALLGKIAREFDGVSAGELENDLLEFLQSLEQDRYIISGETEAELDCKEPRFTYAENPKTAIHNYMQQPDDAAKYADTADVLLAEYLERPCIHGCQIEITNRCNERCLHCYIPHEFKNEILDFGLIISILDQLREQGTLSLTISGGEALLHPKISEILMAAREKDFSINLLTNLTLLTPELVEVLKEANPSLVQTSLYSTVPEEHDHITKLDGSFEKTNNAIRTLIEANIPVQISCPTMKSNFRSYKNVLKYAQGLNCKAQTDFIMMARYDFSTDNLGERLSLAQTKELIKDIRQYDKEYQKMISVPAKEKPSEEMAKEAICGVGRDNLCIASSGIVYPCSGWQGMALGNVKEQPIKDIWEHSPKMLELRSITKGSFPKCLKCEDSKYCAMCLVRNFNEGEGDYMKLNPAFCAVAKINREAVEECR